MDPFSLWRGIAGGGEVEAYIIPEVVASAVEVREGARTLSSNPMLLMLLLLLIFIGDTSDVSLSFWFWNTPSFMPCELGSDDAGRDAAETKEITTGANETRKSIVGNGDETVLVFFS